MAVSFSRAAEEEVVGGTPSPLASKGFREGVEGASIVDTGDFGVGALPGPGCLKMPKLMDFLFGCTLHEMECSALTLTHRTRYDCNK